MIKEVPCMDCDGKGFIAIFSEYSVWSERCPNCGGTGIVKVPMTNADRIRDMSDEELMTFLERVHVDPCSACCDNLYWCRRNNAPEPVCQKHFFKWLQQPAEEDT